MSYVSFVFTNFIPVNPPLARRGCRSKVGRVCFGLTYATLDRRVSVYLEEPVPRELKRRTRLYQASVGVTVEFMGVISYLPPLGYKLP